MRVGSWELEVGSWEYSVVSGEFGDESRELRLLFFYELELTYMTYVFKN